MTTYDTEVLIVGAGPTGLALALALKQANVDHRIVDALPAGLNTSRAAVVHAHTLEMLEELGVVDDLQASGLELSRFTVRDRDQALIEVGFSDLPSAYQQILMIPQPETEAILASHLDSFGGSVQRSSKAIEVRHDDDGAEVLLQTPQGEERVRARFLVGADGMHSAVRAATSIHFQGDTHGASFVLADVRMSWPIGGGEVSLFFSPAGLLVVAPLPDGSFRLVATMDVAPEAVTLADVQSLVDERGPQASRARVTDIVWSSRFRVHHRLASTYKEGRILLMGDAAHVHSPAGGQGMNTGLVDAVVLAKALTAVIRDGAPVASLDHYAEMRRPAAEKVLALASTLTRMATMRPFMLRMARNALLRLLNRAPAFKARLALQLSGIARRDLASFDVLASEVARVRRLEGNATATSPTVALARALAG